MFRQLIIVLVMGFAFVAMQISDSFARNPWENFAVDALEDTVRSGMRAWEYNYKSSQKERAAYLKHESRKEAAILKDEMKQLQASLKHLYKMEAGAVKSGNQSLANSYRAQISQLEAKRADLNARIYHRTY